MTREDLIHAIVETVTSSLGKKVTFKKRIGKDLWVTDTKRSRELAKKKKK